MKKLALGCLVFVVGCGGSTPPPKPVEPETTETPSDSGENKAGPSVSQELGSIDQKGVENTFTRLLNGPLERCHQDGRSRLDYMNGDLRVFLRIGQDGKVRYGYFEESSIGDRDTERCVLDALSTASWPKPVGGEAEVRNSFHWEAGDERAPTSWEPEKVMKALDQAKDVKGQIQKCKSGIKGDLHLTAYVEHDESAADDAKPKAKPAKGKKEEKALGRFRAIGVAATSRDAADKADCVVEALKNLLLPSPGSYAAKVSFVL